MTEGDTPKIIEAKRKEAIKTSSYELLDALVMLQDTFATKLLNPNQTAEPSCELEIFDLVSQSIISFSEGGFNLTNAIARKPRDNDKVRHLPGQHKGVTIKFDNNMGETLHLNVYGGLRAFTGEDFKDSDLSLQRHHSIRTDNIISQPTHLNWHITKPDQQILCEVWLTYQPNSKFSVSHVFWERQVVDITAILEKNDTYGFDQIESKLHSGIGGLVTLIPSA